MKVAGIFPRTFQIGFYIFINDKSYQITYIFYNGLWKTSHQSQTVDFSSCNTRNQSQTFMVNFSQTILCEPKNRDLARRSDCRVSNCFTMWTQTMLFYWVRYSILENGSKQLHVIEPDGQLSCSTTLSGQTAHILANWQAFKLIPQSLHNNITLQSISFQWLFVFLTFVSKVFNSDSIFLIWFNFSQVVC